VKLVHLFGFIIEKSVHLRFATFIQPLIMPCTSL